MANRDFCLFVSIGFTFRSSLNQWNGYLYVSQGSKYKVAKSDLSQNFTK